MLQKLSIRNYALIEELDIEFSRGLTIITGETGAGKSIVLGALQLLMGERADSAVLRDATAKCILEASFTIGNYGCESFFSENDLDYDVTCVIRRELSPQGKSRAFINDTPVNLSQLKTLGQSLMDIHSQHDSLLLGQQAFVMNLIDARAGNKQEKELYQEAYTKWKSLKVKLAEAEEENRKLQLEEDFLKFQFGELDNLQLQAGEEVNLESEMNVLRHASVIREQLDKVVNSLDQENYGVIASIRQAELALRPITAFSESAQQLEERLGSVRLEIQDILTQAEETAAASEANPQRLQSLESRWDQLNHVLHKHRLTSTEQLIDLKNQLDDRLLKSADLSKATEELAAELKKQDVEVRRLASVLNSSRAGVKQDLENECIELLHLLGMPKAILQIDLSEKAEPDAQGMNLVQLLFSANAGQAPQEISKVASGGEFSRLMLSLKKIIARSVALPTIIFDEIDTGVSGAIADKMGEMFEEMSANMQVMVITHLPQIAGKGEDHLKVIKAEDGNRVNSKLIRLTKAQRIDEIGGMLSGKEMTKAALSHARQLLGMTS